MRLRVNELMSKGGGAKKVNIRKWFSNTNCTIMYATVPYMMYTYMYTIRTQTPFIIFVPCTYSLWCFIKLCFSFPHQFFHQKFRKIFIFVKAFAPMAQQSHFFYREIHFLVAKVHTNYQHNRLTNWQDLHNYSENDIFQKNFFDHDDKWKILCWPWNFEPLGQMRSKGHFEREQV